MRLRGARRPIVVPLVALLAAFSWGAAVRVAFADHYHTNCMPHGFVHGGDTYDGSFHSRVETGCGSAYRRCELYELSTMIAWSSVSQTSVTCNAWSGSYSGSVAECLGKAQVMGDLLGSHPHRAHNWCG